MITNVDSEELFELSLQKHDKLVLTFGALWCKNCQKILPIFNNFINNNENNVKIYKIDLTQADIINTPYYLLRPNFSSLDSRTRTDKRVIVMW